jgi:hypothetical protein
MSAAEHRREAATERGEASSLVTQWDHQPRYLIPVPYAETGPYLDSIFWFEPRDVLLQTAEEHLAHAAEHERAAIALEVYEAQHCEGIAAHARNGLDTVGGVEGVRDIPGGVAILFHQIVDLPKATAHLRCHLAWARTQGFTGGALELETVRIEPAAQGRVLVITSDDPVTAREIRRQSRPHSSTH